MLHWQARRSLACGCGVNTYLCSHIAEIDIAYGSVLCITRTDRSMQPAVPLLHCAASIGSCGHQHVVQFSCYLMHRCASHVQPLPSALLWPALSSRCCPDYSGSGPGNAEKLASRVGTPHVILRTEQDFREERRDSRTPRSAPLKLESRPLTQRR